MAGSSEILKFVKSKLPREYDVDLLGLCYDFSQQASSSVWLTAVCSAIFRRDLLLHLNPCHIISAVTALQAAAQLEVVRPIFCPLRDEYLFIDRPDCPFFACPSGSSCCWIRLLYHCNTSSRHIIT